MDLYALPPEEFTAARDAAVKQARRDGDRARAAELAALRRPTVPAHAVNALVRAEPALVEQLLELGGQLAAAQGRGEGGALRALGEQRRRLVEAVADRAEQAAGRPLTPAPRAEVVSTLEAALADPACAQAVRSGRLVRALAYAGFGGVDLAGAVAAPPREPDRADTGRAERDRRRAAAERAALEASGALDDAVGAAEAAERERTAAGAAEQAAGDAVTAAEAALARARQDRDEAAVRQRRAARELERAQEAVATAQRVAEKARSALARRDGS